MTRSGRRVVALSDDQFPSAQRCEGDLNGTFGKASRVGERSYTGDDRLPFLSRGLSVKKEINQIRRRLLIVPDQIAHQDVENVIVDGNGLFEARHREVGSKKDEL
jgi:hypothetical protein